jgi:hypothetical protein
MKKYKLESLKARRVQREGGKKKTTFCELESLFFFLLFFHYSISFALQR